MSIRFCRAPQVESTPLDNAEILFDPTKNRFAMLNETCHFLWTRLAEPRTAQALAEDLCGAFDNVDLSEALRDVEKALAEMRSLELVCSESAKV